MAEPVDDPTPEQLVEALANAGEIDAGVEVLDALRMRDPSSSSLLRLQAVLFMAEVVTPEAQRTAMAAWCNGALDQLARSGALLECAVGYRVLTKVFPEDRLWRERHARIDAAISPLPNPHGDRARAAIDQLVARGATNEAWEALRVLAQHEPDDLEVARRAETFRDLCFETPDTRPYGALTPEQARHALAAPADVAALASRVQTAVREGDLRGALTDAIALSEHAGANPRWVRFRNALQRLVAWSSEVAPPSDEEVTLRTGPVERADLWLRAGNLTQAREAIRAQIAEPRIDGSASAALSARLADLDVVLDGTLPTPIPARPPAAVTGVRASFAPPVIIAPQDSSPSTPAPAPPRIAPPSAPPPLSLPTASVEAQGTEDTVPARPLLGPPETPSAPPSLAPVAGDVKVGKRKIVRLS